MQRATDLATNVWMLMCAPAHWCCFLRLKWDKVVINANCFLHLCFFLLLLRLNLKCFQKKSTEDTNKASTITGLKQHNDFTNKDFFSLRTFWLATLRKAQVEMSDCWFAFSCSGSEACYSVYRLTCQSVSLSWLTGKLEQNRAIINAIFNTRAVCCKEK